MKTDLSTRQQAILEWVEDYFAINEQAPTMVEIKHALNVSSTSVVSYNLNMLIKAGALRRVGGYAASRSIMPVRNSWRALAEDADAILDKLRGANGYSDDVIDHWRGRYEALRVRQ